MERANSDCRSAVVRLSRFVLAFHIISFHLGLAVVRRVATACVEAGCITCKTQEEDHGYWRPTCANHHALTPVISNEPGQPLIQR